MATTTKTAAKAKAAKPAAPTSKPKAPAAKPAPVAAKPAPAAKKPAAATATKAAGKPKAATAKIAPEQHRHYVEVAAYFIAERRGFMGGCEVEDWVMAEREIERMLKEGKLNA